MGPLYSIGRKLIMAITGLFLILFLLEHLVSNLLLLAGDEGLAYNAYAHFMATNGIIKVFEVVLFAGFLFHIIDGIYLSIRNKQARPKGYAKKNPSSDWMSRSMIFTGGVVLIFLVLHLANFFVSAKFGDLPLDANGNENLYALVAESFSVAWYVAVYVVSMIILGLHLAHGFRSSFQTVGWRHSNYFNAVKVSGYAFAIIVPAGFALIPIYFFIQSL